MKTQYAGVDWLLDCEPRLAQLEALARSYTGHKYRDTKYDDPVPFPLNHAGKPAAGWGHFMEMRLGKTPTLLNEFLLFRRDYGFKTLVVFSPNKYKYTWADEIQKFGVLDIPVHVFESSNRAGLVTFCTKNPERIVIVNWEAAQHESNCKVLQNLFDNKTMVGGDESVYIKNRTSLMYKNVIEMVAKAAVTRPLTGKPTPQGVQDLYSQLRFARKLQGVNFFQFRNTFAEMGGFKGKQIIGVKNEERLHRLMEQSCFFARRVDWGTSIEPDFETVKIDMTPEQKKAYQDMDEEFVTWVNGDVPVTADQVVTKHMKLQQISSGFIIDEFGVPHEIVPFNKTPKFVDLTDRLRNYHRDKVIVIAHYNHTISRLHELLAEFNPAVITGSQYMKKAGITPDAEKHRFNNDPSCRVILGQCKAIKYGHTLMGTPQDPCLSTAYFENTYSLDDRAQTEQRNQGEGQLGAINIVDYYSSPVERDIVVALQRKEQVASIIMGYYKKETSS